MDVIVAGYQIEQREDGDNYVILEETLAAEEYGIGSVSYTHLDVYKRQCQSSENKA